LGTKGQHATPRPPKPLISRLLIKNNFGALNNKKNRIKKSPNFLTYSPM